MVRLLKKDLNLRLCVGLTSREFSCQCEFDFCRAVIVSKRLITAYKAFRILVGVSLTINCGHRCTPHNKAVGGVHLSRHQTGEAIDISLKTLSHLSNEEIEHAAKLSGFTKVIFYKTFVHLDVR